jgi:hypothetical protein
MVKIIVKVIDDIAIVRKTLELPREHYALTMSGQWILAPEGKPYPKRCYLPVHEHDEETVVFFANPQNDEETAK